MCFSRCEEMALSSCLGCQICSFGVSCHQLQKILWFRILPHPGCCLHSSVTSLLPLLFGEDCSCSLLLEKVNRSFRFIRNAQFCLGYSGMEEVRVLYFLFLFVFNFDLNLKFRESVSECSCVECFFVTLKIETGKPSLLELEQCKFSGVSGLFCHTDGFSCFWN